MDTVAGGSFSNWASGMMSSACSNSCQHRQHYHRHCSCALHSIDGGFTGSPSCSPSNTVKFSGKASRSGMYRSISVQNFGEKRYLEEDYSGADDDAASAFDVDYDARDPSSPDCGAEPEHVQAVEAVTLVEELASFIHHVREGDESGASSWVHDGDSTRAEAMIDTAACSPTSTPSSESELLSPIGHVGGFAGAASPAMLSNGQAIDRQAGVILLPGPMGENLDEMFTRGEADYLPPLRLTEKPEATPKARRFAGHRRMRSYGR